MLGFERLASLKELKVLNLTSSRLNTSILPSLGALKSLETLVLRNSEIKSVFPKGNSTDVRITYFLFSTYSEYFFGWLEVGNLTSLETLDFSDNFFTGVLPLQGIHANFRSRTLFQTSTNFVFFFIIWWICVPSH